MNMLIVDDDAIVVKDLESSIDWKKLNIDQVFTANNIRQAKDIFKNNHIDILLCDIEMPQGNGLDLLRWVKENSKSTESIFITCHADFGYAKEAIRLGCLDYILKPAQYEELEAAIARAIQKKGRDIELTQNRRFSNWSTQQNIIIERFWIDILKRTIQSEPIALEKAAEERGVPYSRHMRFIPVLISIRRWYQEWESHDQRIMEFGIKNVIGEVIIKEEGNGQIIEFDDGEFIVILSLVNYSTCELEQLKSDCYTCINACHQFLECDLSCYVGRVAFAFELPLIIDKLHDLRKNNVAYDNKVFLLDFEKQKTSVNLPDMDIWAEMLMEGLSDKVLLQIKDYLLNSAFVDGLDASKINQFHHDFIQIVYYTLKQKGVHAHQVLSDYESAKLYEQAQKSVTDMVSWVKHVIGKVKNLINEAEKGKSLVKQIKEYIKLNIEKEISREEIANRFYLNPDYIDRVFKKETGFSVKKYITHERLNTARSLLSKTEMPISTIAISLGYKNLSHFSSAFKKFTNMNPIEYRKAL